MAGYGVKQIDRRRSKKGHSKFFLIIILIAVAGGWYYYKNIYKKDNKEIVNTPQVDTVSQGISENELLGDNAENKSIKKTSSTTSNEVNSASEDASVQELLNPDAENNKLDVSKLSPKLLGEIEKLYKQATKYFQAKDYIKTKKTCLAILDKGLKENNPLWAKTVDMLGKANIEIFTTGTIVPEKQIYNIEPGDSLDKIAKKFNTTIEAIQKSNGLDPTSPMIHPGDQLHIYKGDWHIKVSKAKYKLYLYEDSKRLFKVYNVAIGKQNRTPVGTFEIVEKVREPDWVYHGKRYPYGSKENVLGTRWMRIKPTGTTNILLRGYGIHGTKDPNSIGKQASNGCIRMLNKDVEELFNIIPKYRKIDNSYVDVTITED